jgi:colanic acid/amylovoran biosynthesis glycosyltransferase
LPSFQEGLPVVIMEAMALRRPVIATYVAGIPELVRDGIDGWLVPAGDVDRLVASMIACLEKPISDLQFMGERAHARVSARHAIDREVLKLGALFMEEQRLGGERS